MPTAIDHFAKKTSSSRIFSFNIVCGRGEAFSLELSDWAFLSHHLMILGPRIRLMPIDDAELEIATVLTGHISHWAHRTAQPLISL